MSLPSSKSPVELFFCHMRSWSRLSRPSSTVRSSRISVATAALYLSYLRASNLWRVSPPRRAHVRAAQPTKRKHVLAHANLLERLGKLGILQRLGRLVHHSVAGARPARRCVLGRRVGHGALELVGVGQLANVLKLLALGSTRAAPAAAAAGHAAAAATVALALARAVARAVALAFALALAAPLAFALPVAVALSVALSVFANPAQARRDKYQF